MRGVKGEYECIGAFRASDSVTREDVHGEALRGIVPTASDCRECVSRDYLFGKRYAGESSREFRGRGADQTIRFGQVRSSADHLRSGLTFLDRQREESLLKAWIDQYGLVLSLV